MTCQGKSLQAKPRLDTQPSLTPSENLAGRIPNMMIGPTHLRPKHEDSRTIKQPQKEKYKAS